MRCPRFPTSDFGAAQCISNRKAKLVLTYSRQTPSENRGIWFGTRGSEVQILSPRPIFSTRYGRSEIKKNLTVGKFVTVKSFQHGQARFLLHFQGGFCRMIYFVELTAYGISLRIQAR